MAEVKQPLSLLTIPRELRDQIWEKAVIENKPIQVCQSDEYARFRFFPNREPALLHVSRQLREEALPIYYGCNIFSAESVFGVVEWLEHLSDDKLKALKNVRPFCYSTWEWQRPDDVRAWATQVATVGGRGLVPLSAIFARRWWYADNVFRSAEELSSCKAKCGRDDIDGCTRCLAGVPLRED
ncbi:hypothetical protein LTR17_019664 [Elasticomyces elasticus]|nr:hypothetical protein LTR17_019664 [Elasticomyces elasticus]